MDEDQTSRTPNRFGFLTYSDDTVRQGETHQPYETPPDWREAEADDYPDEAVETSLTPRPLRRARSGVLIAGAMGLVALGVAGVAMVWPRLGDRISERPAVLAETPDAGPVPVTARAAVSGAGETVPATAPSPSPRQPVRLATLRQLPAPAQHAPGAVVASNISAGQAPVQGPEIGRSAWTVAPLSQSVPAEVMPPAVVAAIEPREAPPALESTPRPAGIRLPSPLNCVRPVSPAQEMVCDDPALVAADERMVKAYARAQAAGAPAGVLWKEQISWLNAREAAALRSARDVNALYRERIRDLDAEASSR